MPRGRKKGRGGLVHQHPERQASQDSSGPPRVKETKLDFDLEVAPALEGATTPPLVFGDCGQLVSADCGLLVSPSQSRTFRDKITDFFSYSDQMERSVSPPMPVLLPQVGSVEDPLALPPLSPAYSGPPNLDDCDASDRSEGESGKENEDVLVWRGSRSSIASRDSRGSRPRSGHLSDVTPGIGQQQVLNQAQAVTKPDRVTRSAVGKVPLSLKSCERLQNEFNISENQHSPQSPPTPHKIIRVKEVSGICNPLQKLRQISLTPKKNSRSSTKAAKGTKRIPGQPGTHVETNAAPSPASKAGKLAAAAQSSHKVTEYFPIRRSERKPKAELLKEQMEGIEARLLATDDSGLDIEVVNIDLKGRGIVTSRPFVKGEFVVEYAGDLIDIGTAKDLEAKYSMDTSKGCYMYYFKHKGKQYCIDATSESGRYGRLLNHSRVTPNCVTKVVMLGDTPRLILVARHDIERGTELLYDYGDRSKESLQAHPWLAL